MSDGIPPALTEDEWAEKYVERDAPGAMLSIDADAFGALVLESGAESQEPVTITIPRMSAALSALVALANDARADDDPGKITRRVVELLLAAAHACRGDDHHIAAHLGESEWTAGREDRLAAEYEDAATKLAALLPHP